MKLTAKARYAVTAMVALARHDRAVSLPVLAQEQRISLTMLEQIFAQLRRAGLVVSTRGARGGYRLAVAPRALTLDRIIRAVEVDIRAQGCTAEVRKSCVGRDEVCLTHGLWHDLETHIEDFFARTTVADVLLRRVRDSAEMLA